MSRVIVELANYLRESVASSAQLSDEYRGIFYGPPAHVQRALFDHLMAEGGSGIRTRNASADIPVLLVIAGATPGEDPAPGESGTCDVSYIGTLRNTASCPSFVALVPPDQHIITTLTTTTTSFGIGQDAYVGGATIEKWLEDGLVRRIVATALNRYAWATERERSDADTLLANAIVASDRATGEKIAREGAWNLLAAVLAISDEATFRREWSRICGVPPLADGSISAAEQLAVLETLGAEFEAEGYRIFDEVGENASEEVLPFVHGFRAHLQQVCSILPRFKDAAAHYYAPQESGSVWHPELTVEVWGELLKDNRRPEGSLTLECVNSVIPPTRGVHAIVRSAPALHIQLPSEVSGLAAVVLRREAAGHAWRWDLDVPQEVVHVDTPAPPHARPLRYVAEAPGCRKAAIKVVSLDAWEPGVVVYCRTAKKMELPKRRNAEAGAFDVGMTLTGAGKHYIEVIGRAGIDVTGPIEPRTESDEEHRGAAGPIAMVTQNHFGFEIEATTDCQFAVEYADGPLARRLYLQIQCDETPAEGAASEYERLIRVNRQGRRGRATTTVQIDRNSRLLELQRWLIDEDSAQRSYYPIVLATDYARNWRPPTWDDPAGSVLSGARFLHDPRPPQNKMVPPAEFLAARVELARHIRGADEGIGVTEEAQLGVWFGDPARRDFADAVHAYLLAYEQWLLADHDVAMWADLAAVTAVELDGSTLAQEPYAILVSPLHPVRIAWHCNAQKAMHYANLRRPCPAAAILNPGKIIDTISLPVVTAAGVTRGADFFALDCSSDYWSVLWSTKRLDRLAQLSSLPPFDADLGLQIGGMASGFSVTQVRKALDDVADLRPASTTFNVLVASGAGRSSACNEGVVGWAGEHFDQGEGQNDVSLGERILQVWDERPAESRPDGTTISNLVEDAGNHVRWYAGAAAVRPDLAVIAQLDTSNPSAEVVDTASALSKAGLLRARIRRQLAAARGAFLTESRVTGPMPPSGDGFADLLTGVIARIENAGGLRLGYTFAPNVGVIERMLSDKRADFVAVSSSAVDPACFLGGWLREAYLWDYDLPSYSSRSGDINGYYLLASVKQSDQEAVGRVLATVPGCAQLPAEAVKDVLLEVSRRGIPTVRGLSSGTSGAMGDIGMFAAARVLQDAFRLTGDPDGLLPLFKEGAGKRIAAMVVPLDPFRAYFSELQKALEKPEYLRPDLIVLTFVETASEVKVRLTPVEIKYRGGAMMTGSECMAALDQARNFSALFRELQSASHEDLELWRAAYQHVMAVVLDYGFRVYSQQPQLASHSEEWTRLHSRVLSDLLAGTITIDCDARGRLLVFDTSPVSEPRDIDGDGFRETLVLSPPDTGRLFQSDSAALHSELRGALETWEFFAEESVQDEDESQPIRHTPADPVKHTGTAEEEEGQISATGAQWGGIHIGLGHIEGIRNQERVLNISDTRLNQLNIGVVGDLGTGKTQLLKSLVYQLSGSTSSNAGVRPRVLIFDYKNDYADPAFAAAVGAKVVKPHRLELNLFDTSDSVGTIAPWMERYKFFADVLAKIYPGVGPVQYQHIKDAVRQAYQDASPGSPTIYTVHAKYRALLNGKVDAPLSIISDLVDMEIFAPGPAEAGGFNAFFDGVVVLSLSALGQDDRTKNMLVAIILNMYYEHMLRIPKRPYSETDPQLRIVDSFLLVDEADNIMKYEFDVLRKLLLQGREFGVGVILASQYLSHFKSGATDYREPLLTWFVHKVPNLSPPELAGLGMIADLASKVDRIKTLRPHECLLKTHSTPGEFLRATPFYQLLNRPG